MLIMPSFQKSLIVEQFQGNYLKPDIVLPGPRVHVGQGFLHRHAVSDGIDVAIYFGIVSIKGSENITHGYI